ncbi:MAG TPA: hypothetical protein DDW52_16345, partial [Planctomycetaceae bacterium]|nr:hypothetical protein [Planctomycetaceae bacterium]
RPEPARAPGQLAPVVNARTLAQAARGVSLSALVGITGVVALVAAIWTWNGFAGLLFSFLAAIALIRTILFGLSAKIHRENLLPLELTIAFLHSLVFVTVAAVSASFVFVVVCFPLGLANFTHGDSIAVFCSLIVLAFILYCVPVYPRDRQ